MAHKKRKSLNTENFPDYGSGCYRTDCDFQHVIEVVFSVQFMSVHTYPAAGFVDRETRSPINDRVPLVML